MISYRLLCERGHEFSAQFKNSESYEIQERKGFLECPICNSGNISKLLSAPNIHAKSTDKKLQISDNQAAWRELCDYVKSNFKNVGQAFPDEARKIHHGESDTQKIYGQASQQQVMDLHEEGIKVFPLPLVDEKKKN